MTHTPGPWEVIQLPSMEYRIDAKVGPLHVCPAIAHGFSDAHLIAAAPEMLAALEICPLPSSMGSAAEHYQRFYDWYQKVVVPVVNKASGLA